MERILRYILPVTMTAMLFSACSNDEKEQGRTAVQFQTGGKTAMTRADAYTTRDNMWNMGDQIAVYDVTDTENLVIKQYQTASDGISVPLQPTTTDQFFWNIGQTDMKFVARDQRSSNITDEVYNGYDLLFAPDEQTESGSAVTLDFYHQMVHIIVNIPALPPLKEGDPADKVYVVDDITFGGEKTATLSLGLTGTISMGTTGLTNDDDNTCCWTNVNSGGATGPVYLRKIAARIFECILPPQSNAGGSGEIELLVFYTNVRDDPYHYRVSSYNLKPGYEYTYNISIERIGLTVTSTVTPWTPGSRSDVSASTNRLEVTEGIDTWTNGGDATTETLKFQ